MNARKIERSYERGFGLKQVLEIHLHPISYEKKFRRHGPKFTKH